MLLKNKLLLFVTLSIFLSKWISIIYLNQDVDFITNLIFNLDDHQYFPYIYSLSNLNFSPSFDDNLILKKNLPYPIYSIIYHSIIYKIFNIYGFVIIELLIIFIFFYLISNFFNKIGFNNYLAIILSLLIFLNPFLIDLFNLKTTYFNSFKEIYNLRIPRPSISNLYFFLFLNIILLNDKKGHFKNIHFFLFGMVFALLLSSFYYYLALSALTFLIYFLSIKLKFRESLFKVSKDLFKVFISFLIFSIPIFLILFNAEPDWLVRAGLIDLNFDKKIIIIYHYLEKFLSLPFIIVSILITFFWLFLRFRNFYNNDGINLLYCLFLSSFLSPIIFTLISPTISEIYHFSNMIVGIAIFILFIYSFLILNPILNKIFNYHPISIFVIILLLSYFTIMTFKDQKEKSFLQDRIYSQDIINILNKNNINKNTEILLFDSKDQVNLIFHDYKNLSFVLGIFTPINDETLEEKIIQIFYFLGMQEKNFINFFENKREKGRGYINSNVGKTFYMKYQANKITTFKDSNDFSDEELLYISKVPVLSNQQLIMPKFEFNRLIDKFNNYEIDQLISPKVIIINKNFDKFYEDIELNNNLYCKIDINKFYIVYFMRSIISSCN